VIRTDDLANINSQSYHQTMFEMLGCFSIGGNFKTRNYSDYLRVTNLISVVEYKSSKSLYHRFTRRRSDTKDLTGTKGS
jgi:hypothetical protein